MPITVVFDPPQPSDSPAAFNTKAFATLGDLNTWSTQANALAVEVSADEASAIASAAAASTSATTATTKASEASASASAAAASAASAAASYDSFDDRYLGAKASDPTLDNDGAALLTGALYWNTTSSVMRVYSGSAWVTVSAASGNVVGPASAADNTLPRFDGTTGKLIQGSGVGVDDNNNVTGVASINGGQLAGLRNKIINGKMEIAQRGTSFPGLLSGTYTSDRWGAFYVTSASNTVTIEDDYPAIGVSGFRKSLRITPTTADTSIAANDYFALSQSIEGYNASDLIGNTFTISFWVRSGKTGTFCISLGNAGADRTYVAEYTVNTAYAWEKKTVTITGGLPSSGTWNFTNGVGLSVRFLIASGSTFHTTAGAWQSGNYLATVNQVNGLETAYQFFAITGVQLEVGSVATPFEHRPYGLELALCQRYFETGQAVAYLYAAATAGVHGCNVNYKQVKRAIPTVTTTAGTADAQQAYGCNIYFGTIAAQNYNISQWTASAEL